MSKPKIRSIPEIQSFSPHLKWKDKNKDTFTIQWSDTIDIIVGRSQKGNQMILDMYQQKDKIKNCWWFHYHPSTSAHTILYDHSTTEHFTTSQELQKAFYWIFNCLYRSNDETIFCKLEDVTCTNVLGKVIFKNEMYCNCIQYTIDINNQT